MTDVELMDRMRLCGHILYHKYPMNMAQNFILLTLKNEGDMMQKALMERLNIQAGSLSEIISKVEACGYITRCRCENDKRNFELKLTETGRERAVCFERERDEVAGRMFGSFDTDKKEVLFDILGDFLGKWFDELGCCSKKCREENKGEENA